MTIEIKLEGQSSDTCFDFTVHHDGGVVPATFWNAKDNGSSLPQVTLVQHGGPFHKRHETADWLAGSIVEQSGSAVLLIDGPIHGQRRSDQPSPEDMLANFERYWREEAGIEQMVSDWKLALDAVLQEGWADPERVAWLGMSMGTAYGIPLCASDERIKVAGLGMWGMDWGQEASLLDYAGHVKTPLLFQIKAEDEIFTTEGQRELFHALGSPNKCLRTLSGGHTTRTPGQLEQLLDFISRTFADQGGASK